MKPTDARVTAVADAALALLGRTAGYLTTTEIANELEVRMPLAWAALATLRGSGRLVRRKRRKPGNSSGTPPWEYAIRHTTDEQEGAAR